MNSLRFVSLVALAQIIGASWSSTAQAVSIIDQSHFANTASVSLFGDDNPFAQTFTVGLTGELTGIDIYIRPVSFAAGTVRIGIVETVAGLPSGASLGISGPLALSSSIGNNWYHFDLSSFDISVTAGALLAFQFLGDEGTFGSMYGGAATYASGTGYFFNGTNWVPTIDFSFQTYVDTAASPVPLPAALPLFATALAGGGLIAWRRKRKSATTQHPARTHLPA